MKKNKNIQEQKNLLKDATYNSYLKSLEQFQDSNKAFKETRNKFKDLLEKDDNEYIDIILDEFVDTMFKTFPQSPDQLSLFEAMEVTDNSHGKRQVIGALKEVLKRGNYDGFSRFHNGNKDRNYRQILLDSVSPEDISNIIVDTMTSSIITEKESQTMSQNIGKQYANQINNFQINPATFNKCKQDILQGKQIPKTRLQFRK